MNITVALVRVSNFATTLLKAKIKIDLLMVERLKENRASRRLCNIFRKSLELSITHKLVKWLFSLLLVANFGNAWAQITGNNRASWEREYIPACIDTQSRNEWNKKISKKDIKDYCVCVSDHIIERASVSDANRQTEKFRKIVDDAGVLCTGRYFMNRPSDPIQKNR